MSDAVLGAVTSGAGAALGFLGQQQANATNVRIAREQMAFQERMSSSAHTRNRADLERAGLNPMLGVGGPGASSPVGASARVENAPGAGLHSGLAVRQSQAQVELVKAQTERERAAAMLSQQQRFDLIGKPEQGAGRHSVLSADTLEVLLPLVKDKMGAEIARDLNSAAASRDHASLLRVEKILKEFEMQHAKNLSEAQKSLYFRKVAPYVSSAAEVVGIAGRVATPIAIGRGARAIQRGPLGGRRTGGVIHPDLPVGTLIRDTKTGKVIGRSR